MTWMTMAITGNLFADTSVTRKYNESGSELFNVTTESGYDAYGNLLYSSQQTSDNINTFTRTEYINDTSSWILGMPSRVRVAESDPDAGGTVLRETEITYHTSEQWLVDQKKAIHWEDGTEYEYITSYTYDSYGNVLIITDPRGKTTSITFDSNGMFPVTTKNALLHTTTRTFDPAFGKVLTETGPNNNQTTTYTYDEFGRQKTVTYPDNSSETYTYNVQAGNNYKTVQSTGQPTATIKYDNLGRKKEERVTGGTQTIIKQTTYDNAGRVTGESQPYFSGETANWTTFQYDPQRGYMNRQDNPDNTFKTVSRSGFTETITDEKSHSRTVTRDSLGRNKSILEPYESGDEANSTGGTTYYTYDIFGNLLTTQNPEGNKTTITYDDLGRKTSMDDTYMGYWSYGYDENGNLTSQIDGKGNETTITYDDINRMLTKSYLSDNRVVTHTYDEARTGYYNIGSLTTLSSPEATNEFNYDRMGRQVNEIRTIDSVPYQIDQGYDLAGRLDYIIYPDNAQYDYAYDSMGNLVSVSSGTKTYVSYSGYNALGQTGLASYGNETSTEYFYYPGNSRLAELATYDSDENLIQSIDYTFDDVGNIFTMNVTTETNASYTVNHSFTYDSLDRLRTADATCTNDPSRAYDQDYHYDRAGNMKKKEGIGGWEVLGWDSGINKPRIRPNSVRFDNEVAGVAQRNIVYNQDQKPVQITYNGGTTNLTYDGAGERIKKVKGSETVIYVGGIYEIRNGQAISHIFAHDQKIVTLAGTKEYYSHSDHLGSTSIVTDETGNVVEEIGYLPFGATLFRNAYNGSSWESAYRFTGQEFDEEYHLYNYNARLYDPIMSRFITPDIIVPQPYNPQSLNRYSYVLNNPLRYIDPSGHKKGDVVCDEDGNNCVYDLGEIIIRPDDNNEYAKWLYEMMLANAHMAWQIELEARQRREIEEVDRLIEAQQYQEMMVRVEQINKHGFAMGLAKILQDVPGGTVTIGGAVSVAAPLYGFAGGGGTLQGNLIFSSEKLFDWKSYQFGLQIQISDVGGPVKEGYFGVSMPIGVGPYTGPLVNGWVIRPHVEGALGFGDSFGISADLSTDGLFSISYKPGFGYGFYEGFGTNITGTIVTKSLGEYGK